MRTLTESERVFKPHPKAIEAFEMAMGRKYTKFDVKRENFFETILTILMREDCRPGKLNSEMLRIFAFEIAAKLAEKEGIENLKFFSPETVKEKTFTDEQFLHAILTLLETVLGIVFDKKEPGDDEPSTET